MPQNVPGGRPVFRAGQGRLAISSHFALFACAPFTIDSVVEALRVLEDLDLAGLWAVLSLKDLEFYFVVFLQCFPGSFRAPDSTVVDEHVLPAAATLDETEALGVVEPADGSPNALHCLLLSSLFCSSGVEIDLPDIAPLTVREAGP